MIRGYCIGGGMGLATCCDIRIATEGPSSRVPAAKLGLGYAYPGLKRLVDVVGPSFAMEIFYTARQFTAAEALAMGLVNRVVPEGELESYVKNYADTIAGNAPLTIKAVKVVVSEMMKDESKRDLKRAQDAVDACFKSRDYEEGRKAFMEKRKPVFTGHLKRATIRARAPVLVSNPASRLSRGSPVASVELRGLTKKYGVERRRR